MTKNAHLFVTDAYGDIRLHCTQVYAAIEHLAIYIIMALPQYTH